MDWLKDFLFTDGGLGDLLQTGAAGYGYNTIRDDISGIRDDLGSYQQGTGLYGNLKEDISDTGGFKGYSMRTGGLGSSSMDAQGNMMANLTGAQQGYSDQMRTGAQDMYGAATGANPFAGRGNTMYNRSLTNAFGGQAQNLLNRASGSNQMQNMGMQMSQRAMQDTAGREQDVYDRIRAMQAPGEERQRSQMTANLFGSGRGGMGSGEFGASPEEHGFNMARNEAMNQASMQAMGQAQAEQAQQAQIGSSMFGQGMNERQLYEQMGTGRYGLGQQNQQMYGQMGQQWQQQGLAQQQLQGQLAGQMGSAQYDPYTQLMQQNAQGMQGGQMMNQSGQQLAGMLAQLGIGSATTDVNLQQVDASAFTGLMEMLGMAVGGLGSAPSTPIT